LLSKPQNCEGCPMEKVGEGYVPAEGPEDSRLLIVGEAAGADEASTGRPFVGGAGRILDSQLKNAGIIRTNCRVENVMRCRPPGNKIPKSFDPIECARRYLIPDMKANKHNCILMLGNYPLGVIAGLDGVSKLRGSVLDTLYGKAVATLHPAFLMRQQKLWYVVAADFARARKESLVPAMPPLAENYIIHPTIEQVEGFSKQQYATMAIDIENTVEEYYDTALICIGFCVGQTTMCIPWLKRGGGDYWSEAEKPRVVQALHRLLASEATKTFQNGMHDVFILEAMGFRVENWDFDTMLAHHLCYAELPHKLEFIASVHTFMPYYKDEVKADMAFLALPDKTLRVYNCKDALATYDARPDLLADLKKFGLVDFFTDITMRMPRILLRMKKRGMLVDKAVLGRAIVEYITLAADIKTTLRKLGVHSVTNKDLARLLYKDLGLPVVKRTKVAKAPSADEDALLQLQVLCFDRSKESTNEALAALMDKGYQVIKNVLELRKAEKILSTYLRGLTIGPDGRIHPNWLVHGTRTGRLSSRNPNAQNVPKVGVARRIYTAARGFVLVAFDYNQIELRIVAYDAGDEPLIRAFEEGRYVHAEEAAFMFHNREIQTFKPWPDWISQAEVDFTKSFEYALNYGGTIFAVMAANPGMMTSTQGKIAQARYFARHPKIDLYRKRIAEEVTRTRRLLSPFGRPRIFFGNKTEILNSAYNFPIQGGAAEVINKAIIRLADARMDEGLLLQVHDELLFELEDNASLPEKIGAIKALMAEPVEIQGRPVIIPVEVKTGNNWGDMKLWNYQKS
jgi:uracil-DNA glycosylase family 4